MFLLILLNGCINVDQTDQSGVYDYYCNQINGNYFLEENKLTSKSTEKFCEFTKEPVTWVPPGGYISEKINPVGNLTELKISAECKNQFTDLSKGTTNPIILDEEGNLFNCIRTGYG